MINKLRRYFPDIKLNATKWETFNAEHTLYAKYEREVKKGYSTLLVFEREVLLEIEKPIEVLYLKQEPIPIYQHNEAQRKYAECVSSWPAVPIEKRVFTPVILTTSDEYAEEGSYMNHCVAGYIDNHSYSIIVSLRWGNERVTSQYRIKDRTCVQHRFFYNQVFPSYFEKALNILDSRIKMIPLPIGPINVKKIPLIINGVQVKPDENEDLPYIMLADLERDVLYQRAEQIFPLPEAHVVEHDMPI